MSIPCLNAYQLRAMAEAAAGYRGPDGTPIYLVYKPGAAPDVDIVITGPHDEPPANAVLEVDTPDINPNRPPVEGVVIQAEGMPYELVPTYDAVFWSEAAVEKFVLPYYASKSLWEASRVLAKLTYYWYRPLLASGEGAAEGASDYGVPFALAHTPDSDWQVIETPEAFSGQQSHLLSLRDGKVIATSLAELPDPPPGWRPIR